MHSFKDNAGNSWDVEITIGSVKRVRSLLDVDLLNLDSGDPPLLTRLGEIELLCDVIFALLKPQADERNITDEEWAAGMGGEAILSAQGAFYAELADFFLGLGQKHLATAVTTQKRMVEAAVEAAEARLAEVDVEKEVGEIFGTQSTASPGSPESTPTD